MLNAFEEMAIIGKPLAEGDRCSFIFEPGDTKTFISFLTDDQNCPLHIERSTEGLKVGKRQCETWSYLAAMSVNGEEKRVDLLFGESTVTISVDHKQVTVPILLLTSIKRVCGYGKVKSFDIVREEPPQDVDHLLISSLAGYADLKTRVVKILGRQTESSWLAPLSRLIIKPNPNMIFDIGFHNGDDTDYYLKRGYQVVAVEADPDLAHAGLCRFQEEIITGQLMFVNMAIGPSSGRLPFYRSRIASERNSLDKEMAMRLGRVDEIIIPACQANEIMAIFGIPYYMKIDVEAYDYLLLEAVCNWPARPTYISFEAASPDWLGYLGKLSNAGYNSFAVVDQHEVPSMQVPTDSEEGRRVAGVTFPRGSSGPFGRDIRLPWLDLQGTLDIISRIETDWWDIHASRRLPQEMNSREQLRSDNFDR